ncbi:PREDICTED: MYB-like transcription factor ETC3 isoform X2 [Lupinus angustifolius]|uniref:MYB-like transcription factor ETC3 isoform X2 n=1 Tax=Lupinus angustifolius TaxID=3871 RepID=UPI00092EDEF8|nr:PREDICTED: MYB-like transcription factor ETC3 isoform X2 [Lupinus angustifolius]
MSNKNHATDANIGNNGQQVSGVRRENPKVEFSEDEEDIIAKMFRLVGERWSLIAGRIPGRTAEEIEKYWTTKFGSTSDQCSSTDD